MGELTIRRENHFTLHHSITKSSWLVQAVRLWRCEETETKRGRTVGEKGPLVFFSLSIPRWNKMKGGASVLFGWPGTTGKLCHEGKGTRAREPQKQEAPWQSVFKRKRCESGGAAVRSLRFA
jgi:hypothetical protein